MLDAGPSALEPLPGRMGGEARRFGDLAVLVSWYEVANSRAVRRRLRGGYHEQLDVLLDRFGVQLGTVEVAHWVLCGGGEAEGRVHLAYYPIPGPGVSAIRPTELLSFRARHF